MKGQAAAAVIFMGFGAAIFLGSLSKVSHAEPPIPPLPGPVPPLPPLPVHGSSSPPLPPLMPQIPIPAPPFVEPNGFGGAKGPIDKSKIIVGTVVVVNVPRLAHALTGTDAIYRVTSVDGDHYTGDLVDPLGLNAGALIGMPNTLAFTSADVIAIAIGQDQ